MEPKEKSFLTPEEYLEIERKAEYKSEYYNGEMFAMSGASRKHNLICTNIAGELRNQLKKKSCEVYMGDMRVKVSTTGLYTYPDLVVVCGSPKFEDKEVDTLLNPILIIEVLSESTEAYDRGEKFAQYRSLSSLQEYVLISQDHYHIEKYIKQKDIQLQSIQSNDLKESYSNLFSGWFLTEEIKQENSIELVSIQCSLKLAEVYDKVTFEK